MRAEVLKLRRTLVPRVALLFPLVPAFLAWGVFGRPAGAGDSWELFAQQVQVYWGLLMLPLVVSLLAAQLGSIEHASGGWRVLLALPRARAWTYLNKVGVLLALTATMHAVAFVGALAAAAAIPHAWSGALDVGALAAGYAGMWLASIGISLGTMAVAIRFESFLAPTGIGAAAAVIGMVLINSDRVGPWWPWNLPAYVVVMPELVGHALVYSVGLGAIALAIGLGALHARDV